MVLMSFYIMLPNKSNKGGAFICKSNLCFGAYSVAVFIRVAALNRSFTVTAHLLRKKEKIKDLVAWEVNLDFIGLFVSNR